MKRIFSLSIIALFVLLSSYNALSQSSLSGANVVTSAVPFLTIAPDSRAAAMGDLGVATAPDVNSQHWNAAKYAFIESDFGVALSYSPWLRNLTKDINLGYLVGYKRLDEYQVLSASLRYFNLGDIVFRDYIGQEISTQNPNEFAVDFGYTRLLSERFSGSVAVRYIRSDLTAGQMVNGVESHAGNTFAADVSFYYRNEFSSNRRDNIFAAGINISNIGGKISYTDGEIKDFIPANLRLGASYTMAPDDYNLFSFSLDLNKLLVPTPPRSETDYNEGDIIYPGGINSDMSVVAGIFSSFTDAPGGFKEEMQEINISAGVEYTYNKQFSLRAGYFHEHQRKGNRKFFGAGAGLKLNVFSLDFSYLIPIVRNHPLENTLRFTLQFDIDAFGKQNRL